MVFITSTVNHQGIKMNVELRDYFAAKAMACLITETGLILDTFADDAYDIADKMMIARDKRREETQADPS